MRRKGILTLFAAVFMVLAFSATALAANQVFMKTTVPNIPKTSCYQAGTDTMEFDSLTTIADGDIVTLTLNNNVTICKAINFAVTLDATGGATLDTTGTLPVSTTSGTITAGPGGNQWAFVVTGPVGSQIITIQLRVVNAAGALQLIAPANRMTFTGTALTDKLVFKLFDGKAPVLGFAAGSGIQKYNAATTNYDTIIVAGDNVLCIDTLTLNYTGEYVQNTPNSAPVAPLDKLNFSGDYTIAHILGTMGYSIVNCSKAAMGYIAIGAVGQPDTCNSFNYQESDLTSTYPPAWCAPYNRGAAGTSNRLIIAAQSGTTFLPGNYQVKMQIIVERAGVAKAVPGVYWAISGGAPLNEVAWAGATSQTLACAAAGAPIVYAGNPYAYVRADLATGATPRAPAAATCALTTAQKAVQLTTPVATAIAIPAGVTHLYLWIPFFNYDPAEILAGDVVKVRVTLISLGCVNVGPLDITIGTFGCGAAPVFGQCTFPYFTSLTAGEYWNGIVLVNNGATAGSYTLTAYESDGSMGTATVNVAARGQYVNLLENITWTGAGLGGVPAYIVATSTNIAQASIDGFFMMSNDISSMGAMCRTPGN